MQLRGRKSLEVHGGSAIEDVCSNHVLNRIQRPVGISSILGRHHEGSPKLRWWGGGKVKALEEASSFALAIHIRGADYHDSVHLIDDHGRRR